ncbi:MAG: glycosyltransferase [Pseudonocardiales bacterium]|nr:glycosyltransferase [Jatrophihabitantaceae bacterium]MCW2603205.1 glycosyltransferase [Pseudonocardiales bacterium]
MMELGSVLVIAKSPVPGRVKTRLAPAFGLSGAAELARAALADTFAAVRRIPARRHVLVLDGARGPWIPSWLEVIAQSPGGLDLRLSAAFDAVAGSGPAVLVGMDTPQVGADAFAGFDPAQDDACLGLASDGGYWSIGFADPARARGVIAGVPMSTGATGSHQLSRLLAAGLGVRLLDPMTDVDTPSTAYEVAALHPCTRFAAMVRSLSATVGAAPLERALAG